MKQKSIFSQKLDAIENKIKEKGIIRALWDYRIDISMIFLYLFVIYFPTLLHNFFGYQSIGP